MGWCRQVSSSIQRDADRGAGGERKRHRAIMRPAAKQRKSRAGAHPRRARRRPHRRRRSAPARTAASTSSASSTPPPRAPRVSAAPIAPSSDRIGVPSSNASRQRGERAGVEPVLQSEQRREQDERQARLVTQCAAILPDTIAGIGPRREHHLLERAVGIVGGEQRGSDKSDASSAATQITPGPSAKSRLRSGTVDSGNSVTTMT